MCPIQHVQLVKLYLNLNQCVCPTRG